MGLLASQNAYSTGKLEKADPLPKGRYWIDVFEYKQTYWDKWVISAGLGVNVLNTESFEGDADYGGQTRNWYLFEIIFPVVWGIAPHLGWPTVAGKDILSSDDTVQKPLPEDVPGKYGWVKWAVGGTILVAGVFAVAKLVRD